MRIPSIGPSSITTVVHRQALVARTLLPASTGDYHPAVIGGYPAQSSWRGIAAGGPLSGRTAQLSSEGLCVGVAVLAAGVGLVVENDRAARHSAGGSTWTGAYAHAVAVRPSSKEGANGRSARCVSGRTIRARAAILTSQGAQTTFHCTKLGRTTAPSVHPSSA